MITINMMKLLTLLILGVVFISGCVSTGAEGNRTSLNPGDECVRLCKAALERGMDLSNGPCLSDDNPEWNVEGWVCDVAHWPRESVDNIRENQCDEWWDAQMKGEEMHFVEVTPECEIIREI